MIRTFLHFKFPGDRPGSRRSSTFVLAAALFCVTAPRPVGARDAMPKISEGEHDIGSGQFAYVANEESANISGYRINATTGALTPVPGSPFHTSMYPQSVTVDPTGRFAYVSGAGPQDSPIMLGYRIDAATGTLTPIRGSVAGGISVAMHPSGKFAYVGNYVGSISAYKINTVTGALTAIPGSPFPAEISPTSLAISPSGKFAYASSSSADILGFTINPDTGALTSIQGSPFSTLLGGSPFSLTVDPLERYVYAAAQNNRIAGYTIDPATGALSRIGEYIANSPVSATVDPSGKFVYAASDAGILAYSVETLPTCCPAISPGGLTPLAGSPFGHYHLGQSFVAIDYTGTFAYENLPAVNATVKGIAAYRINSGVLTPISGSPFAAGDGPISMALVRPRTTPIYSASEIPNPDFAPVQSITPNAINNKGEVTGSVVYVPAQTERFASGFLYAGGTTIGVGETRFSTASGINDKTEVVGQTSITPPYSGAPPQQAFLYSNGTTTDLDNVSGRQSAAFGINNAGRVTGSLSTGTGCGFFSCNLGDTHAFLYDGGGLIELGTLGGNFSEGRGINNRGEITGGSNVTAGGPDHLFLYSRGSMRDLGALDGMSTEGTAISDDSQIVGSSPVGFLYRDGAFQRLPHLPGATYSQPGGINIWDDVVGTSDVPSAGPTHAFLYTHDQMVDLNRLVDRV